MMIRNNRRILRVLRLALLPLLIVGVLASCNLMGGGPLTIKECVTDFSNGYTGGNYSTLYTYFSSVGTSDYGAMKDPAFWDTTEFAAVNNPNALTNLSIDSSTNTATATFTNDDYNSSFSTPNDYATVTMTMEQDGLYWYIKTLTLKDSSGATIGTPIT